MTSHTFTVTEYLALNRIMVFLYIRIGQHVIADMSVYTSNGSQIEKKTFMNVSMVVRLKP